VPDPPQNGPKLNAGIGREGGRDVEEALTAGGDHCQAAGSRRTDPSKGGAREIQRCRGNLTRVPLNTGMSPISPVVDKLRIFTELDPETIEVLSL
jgi:hypothetical protein